MTTLYVYLWGVSGSIQTAATILSVALGITLVGRYVARFIQTDSTVWSSYTKKEDREKIQDATVPGKWHIFLFILCLLLAIAMPDKTTIAMMYVIPKVEQAAPSPQTMSEEGREMWTLFKAYVKAEVETKTKEAAEAINERNAGTPPAQQGVSK